MEDEKFKQDLDELFRLFNRLLEEQSMDDIPGVDKSMMKQFQFFFSNYESMKDQISQQLQGQFGEPVKQMVSSLIKQLREQLGEDEPYLQKPETAMPPIPAIPVDTKEAVKKIDELLKNPNLTDEEIDQLLDRRAELL